MNDPAATDNTKTYTAADDLVDIYGEESDLGVVSSMRGRQNFRPWHHPVKQIVRDRQWAELTRRLLATRKEFHELLNYFTLPGVDLLDVRVLSDVCEPLGVKIKYFGFDAGTGSGDLGAQAAREPEARWISAESALRQSGRISSDAVIMPDRLEDIAVIGSQAYHQLSRQPAFDVVNIDACDHLAYRPAGRDRNTFDALSSLLHHQITHARRPWLLFLTTRVEPGLIGEPGLKFQQAVVDNLRVAPEDFGKALAEAISIDVSSLTKDLERIWLTLDVQVLKLYSIGVGKFLLQVFHGQPNLPAELELASAYCYRVHSQEPDMLSLAFRVTPRKPAFFGPSTGGAAGIPPLEPQRAVRIARRAQRLWDLDEALGDISIHKSAFDGTAALLASANYDLVAWEEWLSSHPKRPLQKP